MAEATWLAEELPILEAVRHAEIKGEDADRAASSAVPELDQRRYMAAVAALEQADYLEARVLPGDNRIMSVHVIGLKERGRRAVGQWPSEGGFEAFLGLLQERIDSTDDQEEKGRLRRAFEGIAGIGRQVGTDVFTAWARQQAGL